MSRFLSPALYTSISGLVLCASLFSLRQNSPSSASDEYSSRTAHQQGQGQALPPDSLQYRTRELLSAQDGQSLLSFSKTILSASDEELDQISEEFHNSFNEDSAQALEALNSLTQEIAKESPSKALLLAGRLSDREGVSNIERKLLTEWTDQSLTKVFDHFTQDGNTINSHHLSIISSIVQNEKIEALPKWLEWAHEIPSNEKFGNSDERLFTLGKVAEKLARHVTTESIPEVTEFMASHVHNSNVASHLATLAPVYISSSPKEGMTWLNSLNTKPEDRGMIFGAAIRALTQSDPQEAAKMLSADYFIKNYYRDIPSITDPAQKIKSKETFYDDMLETYIMETLHENPEVAGQNAEVLFDPKRKEAIQLMAKDLLSRN